MPYGHKKKDGLIHIILSGDSTVQDAIETITRALDDSPPLSGGGLLVVDITGSENDIQDDDARALADLFVRHQDTFGGKIAIYVRETAQIAQVSLVSAYSAVDGIEVRPFFDIREIADWLRKPIVSRR